jgi:hypothetical protein
MLAKWGRTGAEVQNSFTSAPTADDDIAKSGQYQNFEISACRCMVVSAAVLKLLVISVTFSTL